jgi:hypothetical protein
MRFPYSRLKHILASEEAYAIIDRTEARGSTWMSGGCAILAFAMHEIIPGAALYALGSNANKVEHVLLRLSDGRFFDGDGVSIEKQLVHRWKTQEGLEKVVLLPLRASWIDPEIPHRGIDILSVRAFLLEKLRLPQPKSRPLI